MVQFLELMPLHVEGLQVNGLALHFDFCAHSGVTCVKRTDAVTRDKKRSLQLLKVVLAPGCCQSHQATPTTRSRLDIFPDAIWQLPSDGGRTDCCGPT